jgi:prepilin-type N-terminal cleavage/methylation domain-containing protein
MLRQRSNNRTAFTLIEILMVVVILGIVSAMIVPQISTRDDLKVAAAARMVMADLIYAQNRSIAEQKMYCVKFDPTAETYGVVTEAAQSTYITHPLTKGQYLTAFGSHGLENITIESADFDGKTTIGFDELGSPYAVTAGGPVALANNGTIQLKCGDYTLTISIEPFTGEMSLP